MAKKTTIKCPHCGKPVPLGLKCERCHHAWTPRDPHKPPKNCPKCKSPYWDKPVEREKISKERKKKK